MPIDITQAKIPFIVLEDGQHVTVLHPSLAGQFHAFPPQTQRKAIRQLEGLLEEIRAKGSLAHLYELGLIDDDELKDENDKHMYKVNIVDTCCWQLAQLLRYSEPTRIAEAVHHLTYIDEHSPEYAAGDVLPIFYLGVAQARNGDDHHAIQTLERAMERIRIPGVEHHPMNMMWARAHLAWVYRKAGRISDAEEQEQRVCNWILGHPSAFSPSAIIANLQDEEIPELSAHILDDPDIIRHLSQLVNLGNGTMFQWD